MTTETKGIHTPGPWVAECEWYRNAERLEAPDPLVTKSESKLAGFVITLSLMAFCFLLIYGATEGYKHVNQVTDSIVEALWPSK